MKPRIEFRPIRPDDKPFLYRVFANTRPDITGLNLGEKERADLMWMQFRAQHVDYQTRFSDADFLIVNLERVAVGRLYVHRRADEIRIIDIALLPERRGQGIGTQLMSDIMHEAQQIGKPVRIHVEQFNRALGWYERLGFVRVGDIQTHYLMEWRPRRSI